MTQKNLIRKMQKKVKNNLLCFTYRYQLLLFLESGLAKIKKYKSNFNFVNFGWHRL